ncbi:hypothetical protein T07_3082 [Trichinella nelsoni]|uniref:Uncharacterized protein n=1 Tax=Trichinella nelsoni TaxID=6336 RepID=A0A0V0SCD1_9BILA|nr:hypothetical protein T07_3082 [Trichinella nelsoni]
MHYKREKNVELSSRIEKVIKQIDRIIESRIMNSEKHAAAKRSSNARFHHLCNNLMLFPRHDFPKENIICQNCVNHINLVKIVKNYLSFTVPQLSADLPAGCLLTNIKSSTRSELE